jgi:serine/threonine-protein kinase
MPARANDVIAQKTLKKEAQLLSVLKHKHIIKLVAYGRTLDDEPYLCLEYINAPTLEQLLKNQRSLSLPRSIEICSQIADALEYTHLHHLIHNDLKPANILIANKDDTDWVYVVDFGIATDDTAVESETDSCVITTLLYAPPELYKHKNQKHGHPGVGLRADVYQLGLIFYECLTGQMPFDVSYNAVLDHRNRGDIVPAVSQSGSSILPRSVKSLLLKALARDPDKRQESMQALLDEMREAVSNIVM